MPCLKIVQTSRKTLLC